MEDYKKLNNQPLRFVLAEFRFSPVMKIAEYIPSLQDTLRKRYPIPEKKIEQGVHVQPAGIAVSSQDRWSFVTANKKSAVEINQERLIYYTAEYSRFQGFSAACKETLEALVKIVEPGLILRIGLRYSDLVEIDENESVSDLVNPHFALPGCLTNLGNLGHQRSETILITELGRLVIRTLYGYHDLLCLPDIQGPPITVDGDTSPNERIILDFDHFWESSEEAVSFEIDEILNKLSGLHKISRQAFWQITTDYARNEKWA